MFYLYLYLQVRQTVAFTLKEKKKQIVSVLAKMTSQLGMIHSRVSLYVHTCVILISKANSCLYIKMYLVNLGT